LCNVSELVDILEEEEITDFSKVGELFAMLNRLKPKEKKKAKDAVKKELEKRNTVEARIGEIKEKRIKFLEEEEPTKVLSAAMFVAGYSILNDLNRNQIRKVLEMMGNIKKREELLKENELKKEVAKVRYMLAYSAGRNKSVKPLMSALDPLLSDVKSCKDFERVYEFVQSIVAFHYFLGGGD